jgi:anti-anti-sigma regulatory factor
VTVLNVTIVLPPALTFDTCAALQDRLLRHADCDITLDGSQVAVISGIYAQLLASAALIWAGAGRAFDLVQASDPLRDGLTALALWPLPRERGAF